MKINKLLNYLLIMSKQFQNLLAELGSLDSSSKRDISPSYTNKSRR